MEKRLFAAVLISIGFLWLWAAVAPKLFPELMKKPVPAKVETTSTAATMTTSTQPAPVTASTATTPAVAAPAEAPAVAPIAATAQTITKIESSDYVAKFTNRGAEPVSFQLTHYKARPSDKNDQTLVELVKEREPNRSDYPFAIEATDANFMRRANSALYAVREFDDKGAHVVEYRWSDGAHAITKTFRF